MLGNFIQETTTAPGTSASVNLAGAPTGRVPFSSRFTTGQRCFYGMDDGTQAEAGYGTFTTGSPNTFSRDQVLWNSAGTTARLNFTGATKIYNDVPAERFVYMDSTSNVALPALLTVATGLTVSAGGANVTGGLSVSGTTTLTGNVTTNGSQVINFSSFGLVSVANATTAAAAAYLQVLATGTSLGTFIYGSGAGSQVGSITTNGSATSFNTTSDHRLKVVHGAADTGALIDAVPVHQAEMKHGHARPMFLAHELQAALPDAVRGEKDALDADGNPVWQTVDHGMLVPILWAEIRDLRRRLATLEGVRA